MAKTHGPSSVLLILLWTFSLTEAKEAHVTCIFYEDCMLPCNFKPIGAVVIHWYKQQIPVHSYYYNKDQFGLQNKHFNGRTCLFNTQIAIGNASLLLKKVKVQDKGRYKCYTSTKKGNQETFVNLRVKAPIQSVRVEMTEERVSCSSNNIYPAPLVVWSTEPPSDQDILQNSTIKTPDSKGLFHVESTVRILGNLSDYAYFCSVISADKAQMWTASWKNQDDLIEEEGHELFIECMAPHDIRNFSLTWTFTRTSESTVIVSYDSKSRQTFNLWDGHLELDQNQVLVGNGSLLLHSPESHEHSGIYTCVFSGLQSRHTVQTNINITVASISEDEHRGERSWWGTAASVAFFVFTISVGCSRCLKQRDERTKPNWKHWHPIVRSSHTDTAVIEIRSGSHRHNGVGVDEAGPEAALNTREPLHTPERHTVKGDIAQHQSKIDDELGVNVQDRGHCLLLSGSDGQPPGETAESQSTGHKELAPHYTSDQVENVESAPYILGIYAHDVNGAISRAQKLDITEPHRDGNDELEIQLHQEVDSDQTLTEDFVLQQMDLNRMPLSRTYQAAMHLDPAH